jgi:rubredoxin
MARRRACPKCGRRRQVKLAWNRQRNVQYAPDDPRTFDVILVMHSCDACQYVWMDAKVKALLDEASAARRTIPAPAA